MTGGGWVVTVLPPHPQRTEGLGGSINIIASNIHVPGSRSRATIPNQEPGPSRLLSDLPRFADPAFLQVFWGETEACWHLGCISHSTDGPACCLVVQLVVSTQWMDGVVKEHQGSL